MDSDPSTLSHANGQGVQAAPLAYIVLAHKQPRQLRRLLDRISAGGSNSIYLHIDKKCPASEYAEMRRLCEAVPKVVWLERQVCQWSYFGQTQATILGIEAMIERDDPFTYAVFLTGQDYPLHSDAYIKRALHSQPGRSYIEHHAFPYEAWATGGWDRVLKWHFVLLGRPTELPSSRGFPWNSLNPFFPRRSMPAGLHPHGGSAYWALTRTAIGEVYRFMKASPSVLRFFRNTRHSSEFFVHTIVANSYLKDSLIADDLHYIDWPSAGGRSHPRLLTMADAEALRQSQKLFARKFVIGRDDKILEFIDVWIAEESCSP